MRKKIICLLLICVLLPALSIPALAATGQDVVAAAEEWLGTPYGVSDGSGGPGTSADCSGLTMQVYAQFGISLGRTTHLQKTAGEYVAKEDLQPGDLVCMGPSEEDINHVGIYVGDETIIHAPGMGRLISYGYSVFDWAPPTQVQFGRRFDLSQATAPERPIVSGNAAAAGVIQLKLQIGSPYLYKGATRLEIDPGAKTAPKLIDGRTMLPVRAVVEALGGTVSWDGAKGQTSIKIGQTELIMWNGMKQLSVNGTILQADMAPQLIDDRTYVPIRLITDHIPGCQVVWDGTRQSVQITYSGA